jgi:hypothetical protein
MVSLGYFAGIFDKLNINYHSVYPGTRTGFTIDEELEDWDRADDVLLYTFLLPKNLFHQQVWNCVILISLFNILIQKDCF